MFPVLPVFEFVIGVEVGNGVAFETFEVVVFEFRAFAFEFAFDAVSPQDVSANVPATAVRKYPAILFIFSVS